MAAGTLTARPTRVISETSGSNRRESPAATATSTAGHVSAMALRRLSSTSHARPSVSGRISTACVRVGPRSHGREGLDCGRTRPPRWVCREGPPGGTTRIGATDGSPFERTRRRRQGLRRRLAFSRQLCRDPIPDAPSQGHGAEGRTEEFLGPPLAYELVGVGIVEDDVAIAGNGGGVQLAGCHP